MRNKLLLSIGLLCILFSFNSFASTEVSEKGKMTIKILEEKDASFNKKSNASNKSTQTTTTQSKVQTAPPTLYTGWQNVIPNTQYWIYMINNVPVKGWYYVNGWYYFDENSSLMYINQWKESNGKWYYLGVDGKMLVNANTPDGYYVDANGVWNGNGSNNSTVSVNKDNSGVADESSKYLYNRVIFSKNSSSITKSTKLDGETLKKNIIKVNNDGEFYIPNTKKYVKLTFDYLIEEPNKDNEYDLEIYINDELATELTDFSSSKRTFEFDFEENSTILFKWHVNTEDGSKVAKAVNLYVYNGILSK